MVVSQGLQDVLQSRSPHGERGLKYLMDEQRETDGSVAPPTGSVD